MFRRLAAGGRRCVLRATKSPWPRVGPGAFSPWSGDAPGWEPWGGACAPPHILNPRSMSEFHLGAKVDYHVSEDTRSLLRRAAVALRRRQAPQSRRACLPDPRALPLRHVKFL